MRKDNPNPSPFSKGDPQLTGLAQKVGAVEKGEVDVLNSLFGAVAAPAAKPEDKAYLKRGSLKANENDYNFIKLLSSMRGIKQYDLMGDMVKVYFETLSDEEKTILKKYISE